MNEPNPPQWPPSVKIFHPTDDLHWLQQELCLTQDPVYQTCELSPSDAYFTCENHFSSQRTALLFAPGIYRNLRFEVGYYVQVLGLGRRAQDVQFVLDDDDASVTKQPQFIGPFVPALNKHTVTRDALPVGTSLDTFWRSAENFAVSSTAKNASMLWAVSQAAPLRRVCIQGNLYLHDGPAYASGGHLANARVDGTIHAGGQQQFCFRNVLLGGGSVGGAWSMVYVGCTGVVPLERTESNGLVVTVVSQPRVRMEKPYIAIKNKPYEEEFELRVPQTMWNDDLQFSMEPLLDAQENDSIRDFSAVCVVRDTDPISRIQAALDEGKDVVLCPGIYRLVETLIVCHPNQVILGLGLATLEAPRNGGPCIHVLPCIPGVRLAGIMLEATELEHAMSSCSIMKQKSSLLVWGEKNSTDDTGCRNNPGGMWDIFIRVGGASQIQCPDRTKVFLDSMMCIHSGFVMGDNLWLWRADHAVLGRDEIANYPHISPIYWQTEENDYRVQNGLVVTGNDVTLCGLAVEHANGHQTVWSGQRGAVYFYQCELPYDSSYSVGQTIGARGEPNRSADQMEYSEYSGFQIDPSVKEHELHAPGIYSNFRNEATFLATAIRHPDSATVKVVNPFTVKLDNLGGICSIANGKGARTNCPGIPIRL